MLHSPVPKHSKDHCSQLLPWAAEGEGTERCCWETPERCQRHPWLCSPAPPWFVQKKKTSIFPRLSISFGDFIFLGPVPHVGSLTTTLLSVLCSPVSGARSTAPWHIFASPLSLPLWIQPCKSCFPFISNPFASITLSLTPACTFCLGSEREWTRAGPPLQPQHPAAWPTAPAAARLLSSALYFQAPELLSARGWHTSSSGAALAVSYSLFTSNICLVREQKNIRRQKPWG